MPSFHQLFVPSGSPFCTNLKLKPSRTHIRPETAPSVCANICISSHLSFSIRSSACTWAHWSVQIFAVGWAVYLVSNRIPSWDESILQWLHMQLPTFHTLSPVFRQNKHLYWCESVRRGQVQASQWRELRESLHAATAWRKRGEKKMRQHFATS